MKHLLDRRGEHRSSENQIKHWLESENSQFVPIFNNLFALTEDACLRTLGLLELRQLEQKLSPVYLGHHQQTAYFMQAIIGNDKAAIIANITDANITDTDSAESPTKTNRGSICQWRTLRQAAPQLPPLQLEIALYASGLYQWHQNHQYCAKCGHITTPAQAGHSRICNNRKCKKEHFPKIEPAVIFSVERNIGGKNHILLARQASWPKARYSVLAGFVEHGESVERAVYREAMEETGISIESATYFGSQPWPFPSSLMIAFQAVANSDEITLFDDELEQARWFSIEQLESALRDGSLKLPYSVSISHSLIRDWYFRQKGSNLQNYLDELNDKTQ